MTYKTIRLTAVAHVMNFWEFIREGLEKIGDKANGEVDVEAVRKTMHWLVKDEARCWFAVVVDKYGTPLAFAVVNDATPPFEEQSVWQVRWFYHTAGHFDATLFLKKDWESFAISRKIGSYLVTSNRKSGAAIRCFQSERYGFEKSFITYERKLNYAS